MAMVPPERPLPTKSFASPTSSSINPPTRKAPKLWPADPWKHNLAGGDFVISSPLLTSSPLRAAPTERSELRMLLSASNFVPAESAVHTDSMNSASESGALNGARHIAANAGGLLRDFQRFSNPGEIQSGIAIVPVSSMVIQQIVPARGIVQALETERSEDGPGLFRDQAEKPGNVFGPPRETGP